MDFTFVSEAGINLPIGDNFDFVAVEHEMFADFDMIDRTLQIPVNL